MPNPDAEADAEVADDDELLVCGTLNEWLVALTLVLVMLLHTTYLSD